MLFKKTLREFSVICHIQNYLKIGILLDDFGFSFLKFDLNFGFFLKIGPN